MVVRKSGRTTRLTEGRITATDVTLRVGYSDGFLVFTDQFLVTGVRTGFSGPGDSGSLIVDAENHAVGLLFAGSPFTTVANRWSNVAKALKIKYQDIEVGLDFEPEPGLADNGDLEQDLQALLEVVGAAHAFLRAITAPKKPSVSWRCG